jgi:hypothetical protein
MSLRHAYAPMLPKFDPFLFASVGEEIDGVPLSVLSVLTRLDLDPREEAARLSHLTKEAAADQLASMIARLSDRSWTLSETRRIADRLIERLPTSPAGKPDPFENWRCAYTQFHGSTAFGLPGVADSPGRGPHRQWPSIPLMVRKYRVSKCVSAVLVKGWCDAEL